MKDKTRLAFNAFVDAMKEELWKKNLLNLTKST